MKDGFGFIPIGSKVPGLNCRGCHQNRGQADIGHRPTSINGLRPPGLSGLISTQNGEEIHTKKMLDNTSIQLGLQTGI